MNLFSPNERHHLLIGIVVGFAMWSLLQTPAPPELKGKRVVVCGASTGEFGENLFFL